MPAENIHSIGVKDALNALQTSESGLSGKEAEKRLLEFGKNALPERKKIGTFKIFARQFHSFLVYVLIFAIVLYILIGDIAGAAVIGTIVVINAVLGFAQEFKSEKAMEALKKMAVQSAVVLRDGTERTIDSKMLVPGDIILLSEGPTVPADARIIESINLQVDEAILTGESVPVRKKTDAVDEKSALGDRTNMLYMGTAVTYGRGKAIVVATGLNTEAGKIAEMLHEEKETDTPLSREIEKLGKFLGILILGIILIISLIVLAAGKFTIYTLESAIALAVAAIPEGLPAILTITLAIGMYGMAKKGAIVRKMLAVETLGSVNVICSDKTGTLTKNELSVREIYLNGKKFDSEKDELYGKEAEMLFKTAALCSNAHIGEKEGETFGDPTEIALLKMGEKNGLNPGKPRKEYSLVAEVPFSSERKMMSVLMELGGKKIVFSKGAAEKIIAASSKISTNGTVTALDERKKNELLEMNREMARRGLRVLAFAYKEMQAKEEIETNLVFTAFAGMIDAPRPEVKEAVKKCKAAGIDVKMVTGDHELTAVAVAEELGMMNAGSKCVSGKELDCMDDDELAEKIENMTVFARVDPVHKVRIIEALHKKNKVVAMTGDGVNDAPALQKADIGIAMGKTGTDVAKGASDIVITDDNFATIVEAVESGRKIYSNIRSFIKYLLTANSGEVLAVGSATLINALIFEFPLPLLPMQILWVNLVTDGIPALALSRTPIQKGEMEKWPRPKGRGILHKMIPFIATGGILAAISTLIAFWIGFSLSYEKGTTMALTALILFELLLVFRCSSGTSFTANKTLAIAVALSLLAHLTVMYLPLFANAMRIVPLGAFEWAVAILLGMPALFVPYIARIFSGKGEDD